MKHFPPFSFDRRQRALWQGSSPVPLTPKAAALLDCLLARSGGWVSKATILSEVWPDTHVQPDNIKVLIREIRQALSDSPRVPRFVASVHGLGYAFVAPVTDPAHADGGETLIGAGLSGLVERRVELAALLDAWEAARVSQGRVILVSGDHGVGKTVLCGTLLRRIRADGVARICYGQCFDRELPHEPYYPLLDALHRLDRLHRDLVPALLARHAPSWLTLFPQWSDGRRPVESRPETMLDELGAVLEAASQDLPLIMVIEDLQWADAGTLDVLSGLARSRRGSKLLVVGTCCDGEWSAGMDGRTRLRSALRDGCTIELGPLTIEQVAACVDARFGWRRVSSIAPSMHAATSGNALLVSAALDGLIARGLVAPAPGGWRRHASADTLARLVPEILRDGIVEQLEQLDAREGRVVEAAAAVGPEFTSSAVAYALDTAPHEVRTVLLPLARRGHVVVGASPDGARRAEDAYRFRHALYATVAAARAPRVRQRHLVARLAAFAERSPRA